VTSSSSFIWRKRIMKKHVLNVAMLGLSLNALGCGADDGLDPENGSSQGTAETVTPMEGPGVEPTHEFTVGATEYTLVETEQGDFLLSAAAPLFVAKFPHQALLEKHGPLTMLVLLQALAPAYRPNARLVDYHRRQAELYGRAELSVRRVELVDSPIEKSAGTDCLAYAELVLSTHGADGGTHRISALAKTTDKETTAYTQLAQSLAVCNDYISSGVSYTFGWQYHGHGWNYMATQTLPQYSKAVVYGARLPSDSPLRRHSVQVTGIIGNVVHFATAWRI
jgi:hypothetical protein